MSLPKPPGEKGVGYIDYEFPCDSTNPETCLKCEPLKDIFPSHCLVRIYYPAASTLRESGLWMPSSEYHSTYGNFMGLPRFLSSSMTRAFFGSSKIWAEHKAQPLTDRAALVIFSHGLGGMRTTYSSLCTALASHGYVVAAVEHRDGSAGNTVLGTADIVVPQPIPRVQIPYIHPPKDSPELPMQFRNKQLARRTKEIQAVIDLFSHQTDHPILSTLINLVTLEKLAMLGHSFGGASAVVSADIDTRIATRMVLDPWMEPVSGARELLNIEMRMIKTRVVDTSHFQWEENLYEVEQMIEKCPGSTRSVIPNCDHMDQSDVPVMVPKWLMRLLGKGKNQSDPEAALNETIRHVIDWIEDHHKIEVEVNDSNVITSSAEEK